MSETWKQWEGRTVAGRFPLQNYLGGSDHSGVFLTMARGGRGDSEKAAIKLIPADPAEVEKRLLRWDEASELAHPNLIRIFEGGRCELDGTALLYVVEEYAEENLSQILPERALTAEETRGMLAPILRALQYVHDSGFVHGHLQPSNILAAGDQVKLSSDALNVPGEKSRDAGAMSVYDSPEAATGAASTATDVWQLGMTLVEVLTQRLPVWDRAQPSAPEISSGVPEPFREIAGHCLQVEAGKRWTVAEILARLEMDRLEAPRPVPTSATAPRAVSAAASVSRENLSRENLGQQRASKKWSYLLGLAAVVAVAFVLIPRHKRSGPTLEVQSTQSQPGATAENSPSVNSQSGEAPTKPKPKPSPGARGTSVSGGEERASTNADNTNANVSDKGNSGGVMERVMPQVSPSARRTIHGTIKVRVKVEVDAAGNVAKATLESAGPSKYFSRLALEAAGGWKFSPAQAGESGAREWTLQFAYSRAKTETSAVRAKR